VLQVHPEGAGGNGDAIWQAAPGPEAAPLLLIILFLSCVWSAGSICIVAAHGSTGTCTARADVVVPVYIYGSLKSSIVLVWASIQQFWRSGTENLSISGTGTYY